ncbi:MAG: hypothetical protein AAF960_07835 [Bacteroidota bacterium]
MHGTWNMRQVYDNSVNVTNIHNPKNDRWVTFFKDGSFKSGGAPYGKNGGYWTLTETNNILFLDSNAGERDDSYWVVNITKDSMDWSSAKSSFTERFRISYSKGQ